MNDQLLMDNYLLILKSTMEVYQNTPYIKHELCYAICIRPEDELILEMYPAVMEMEGLKVYEYPDQ